MYKIFASRTLPGAVIELLEPHCDVVSADVDATIPTDQLAAICRGQAIEGLLSSTTRITKEFLAEARSLRVIAHMGKGVDHIDVAAATARGVIVTNTPGAPEEATADAAFALLLAVARRVAEADHFVRQGDWNTWRWGLLWGANVYKKTIGVYGFGDIGQAVARRAGGFSMRVLYYQRRRAPVEIERELRADYVEPEALIRESDFITLHVPLTTETRHLISSRQLAWMKPTAFLINTARGAVVDEQALVDALVGQRIAGAGLDVFEHEPRVHPELLKLQNVTLMPHLGSATAETRTNMAMRAAENLLAALNGRRPPDLLNPEAFDSRR